MGRPKVSDPRSMMLKLYFTATEYECLVRRAKASGMRPVHYGRMLVLDKDVVLASHQRAPNPTERLNYMALSRVGSNLNQMMRHLHQTGEPVPADLEPLLKDIRQIIERGIKNGFDNRASKKLRPGFSANHFWIFWKISHCELQPDEKVVDKMSNISSNNASNKNSSAYLID